MELKNLKRLILILHLATNFLTVNSFNLCYFKIDEEIIMQYDLDEDVIFIKNAMSKIPDHSRVTEFIPGPGIHKLKLKFDIKKLRNCFKKLELENKTQNKKNDYGFSCFFFNTKTGTKKMD